MYRGRSRSPEDRSSRRYPSDRDRNGSGPGPSRPPYDSGRRDDGNYSRRGGRDDRRGGFGSDRPRDSGYGGQNGAGNGDRKREYTEDDRERERRDQRAGYDDRRRTSVSPPPKKDPPKPNFAPSGLLAAETNTVKVDPAKAAAAGKADVKGVLLKYNEPPEARKPTQNFRLYVFKGSEQVELIQIYRQSAYLVGRDRIVADIPISHPSASKQHAVIQYRQVVEKSEFGDTKTRIKPFVIDLDSTNGTFVNDEQIPASRYYEIRENDILKFAQSTREYVLLSEDSAK